MNKNELQNALSNLKINSKFYSLDEGLKENAYNIKQTSDNLFAVFYFERGEVIKPKVFKTFEEACDEMLILLKKELSYGIDLS